MSEVDAAHPFKYGICHFCNKPIERRFFSGSYETYNDCSCEDYHHWEKLTAELTALENAFLRAQKIHHLESQIKSLTAELYRTRRT